MIMIINNESQDWLDGDDVKFSYDEDNDDHDNNDNDNDDDHHHIESQDWLDEDPSSLARLARTL